ncbi:MAG: HlyD family efflux transporter periplasmic adaptor subunit [Candidatus Hydrogenedens sp.]|nr:HlyD family efflux transporter periplasmic adaptor subunit [Candidatus Hydrogenedens sp.]
MAKTATAQVKSPSTANPQVRHPIKAAALLYSAPGFILRGPIYVMIISLVAMLIYSIIATMDNLVVAPLKLQRQTVTIQAIGGGLIDSLEVGENGVVRTGTRLAVIQEKIRAAATPEQEAIDRQTHDYQERLAALTRDYDHARRQLESQLAELEAKQATGVGALENKIGQLHNQLARAGRAKASAEQDLGTARSNLARLQPLCRSRDIPVTQCEQAEQRVNDLKRAVDNAQTEIENADLSLRTAQHDLAQLRDPSTADRLQADIDKTATDYDTQKGQLEERIRDLNLRRIEAQTLVPGVHYEGDKAIYTSPVDDGIVTTVQVQRGQLVEAGKPVVTIVRTNAPLMARVLVQNKDIGQLKIGQNVQLKYFAYPFQEYGIQTGSIDKISKRPSTQPGEESLYVVDVALASETIRGRTGVDRPLEIGLQGIAEIKTGERRFIELLFAPAQKFFQAEPEKPVSTEAAPARTP